MSRFRFGVLSRFFFSRKRLDWIRFVDAIYCLASTRSRVYAYKSIGFFL